MPAFFLDNLGRNVIRLAGGGRVTVTNTTLHPAHVFVDVKDGGAWRPFSGRVMLEAGGCWSASREELGHDQIRVIAGGRSNGRHVVRVEH